MSTMEKQLSFSPDSSARTTEPFKLPNRMNAGLSIEEKTLALFQPDILLPAQYLATTRGKISSQPEKKLMLAILEDAIVSFQKLLFAQNGRGKTLLREAEEWIFQENSLRAFSFENVCEALEVNPSYLRRGLVDWKRRELAKRHKAQVYPLMRPEGEPKKRLAHESGAKKQKFLKAAGC